VSEEGGVFARVRARFPKACTPKYLRITLTQPRTPLGPCTHLVGSVGCRPVLRAQPCGLPVTSSAIEHPCIALSRLVGGAVLTGGLQTGEGERRGVTQRGYKEGTGEPSVNPRISSSARRKTHPEAPPPASPPPSMTAVGAVNRKQWDLWRKVALLVRNGGGKCEGAEHFLAQVAVRRVRITALIY
jgi:hypothetical protein